MQGFQGYFQIDPQAEDPSYALLIPDEITDMNEKLMNSIR